MEPTAFQYCVLTGGPSVPAAIAAVAAHAEAAVLDSADTAPGRGRYTVLACEPLDILIARAGDPEPFEALGARLSRLVGGWGTRPLAPSPPPPRPQSTGRIQAPLPGEPMPDVPFTGGWIGYFAYEAGHYIERLPGRPRPDIRLPVARWGLYDSAAIHDAMTHTWTIVAADLRPYHGRAAAPAERIAFWTRLLDGAAPPQVVPAPRVRQAAENLSQAEYLASVRRAKEYIAAGDIFQVNLARRISVERRERPIQTYLRLRHQNPAAYAAYLAWDGGASAILSASPELFLDANGSAVTTRPIKGTRPRSTDLVLDASYREALLASEKDRAELAMIVDLERNDLGRVCDYGTVRVCLPGLSGGPERDEWVNANRQSATLAQCAIRNPPFAMLESHPTVHHLVATVTGRLRPDAGPIDLLRATFPGGSITGAPKVRAMEIIDELEPTQRSVYTGAIGHISLNGRMQLNIAIRTIQIADGQAHIHVGSGIVADSDPHEEYAETVAKAAGLCAALGMSCNAPSEVRP